MLACGTPVALILTIAAADLDGAGTIGGLLLTSTVQTTGLLMLVGGAASGTLELVKDSRVAVAPMVDGTTQGVGISGRF